MKKIILTLFFIFAIFSVGNIKQTNAEPNVNFIQEPNNKVMMVIIANLEREVYLNKLIQKIEFEAEVVIPKHFNTTYVEYIYNISTELSIPIRTAFRLVKQESSFRDSVESHAGAYGLMQLMPRTREMCYNNFRVDTLNLDRNKEDIYIGLNYLKKLHNFWVKRKYKNSWDLALASYNAGKGNVLKYRAVPPYVETTEFVLFINKPHSNPKLLASYSRKYQNRAVPIP